MIPVSESELPAAAAAACMANPPSISNAWKARLIKNQRGKPAACLENALVALRHATEWQSVLQFNESSLQVIAKSRPPWDSRAVPFAWRDDDDVNAAAWMQRQSIMVGQQVTGQAIQAIAREHPWHPIRDYLNSLHWDQVQRIDHWLTVYLDVDPSDYSRAVGAKWLIGAVARIFKPGCKNDSCLILEGPQGSLKSTALRTLAEPWFTDDIAELGTKDSALQTHGVWIIELAELDAMTRPEVSRIKAFMSRSTDRFRPPYGSGLSTCRPLPAALRSASDRSSPRVRLRWHCEPQHVSEGRNRRPTLLAYSMCRDRHRRP